MIGIWFNFEYNMVCEGVVVLFDVVVLDKEGIWIVCDKVSYCLICEEMYYYWY